MGPDGCSCTEVKGLLRQRSSYFKAVTFPLLDQFKTSISVAAADVVAEVTEGATKEPVVAKFVVILLAKTLWDTLAIATAATA